MARKFIWQTPEEINMDLAMRIKKIRKRRRISQQQLSKNSGVSYGSIKRFEETGNISLLSLSKIAISLNIQNELNELFTDVAYQNIEEVIRGNKR